MNFFRIALLSLLVITGCFPKLEDEDYNRPLVGKADPAKSDVKDLLCPGPSFLRPCVCEPTANDPTSIDQEDEEFFDLTEYLETQRYIKRVVLQCRYSCGDQRFSSAWVLPNNQAAYILTHGVPVGCNVRPAKTECDCFGENCFSQESKPCESMRLRVGNKRVGPRTWLCGNSSFD